ncbi:MAG: hypothetical protein WB783_20615 [Arenicellales bacterium]
MLRIIASAIVQSSFVMPLRRVLSGQLYADCEARALGHSLAAIAGAQEQYLLLVQLLRDIERGARTEADHVLGDLLAHSDGAIDAERSLLRLATLHAKAYEARRSGNR